VLIQTQRLVRKFVVRKFVLTLTHFTKRASLLLFPLFPCRLSLLAMEIGTVEGPEPTDPYTCYFDDFMKNFSRFRVLTMLCWCVTRELAICCRQTLNLFHCITGGMWCGVRCISATLTTRRPRLQTRPSVVDWSHLTLPPAAVQRDGVELFYDAASYLLNLLAVHAAAQPEIGGPQRVRGVAQARRDPTDLTRSIPGRWRCTYLQRSSAWPR